MHAELPVRVTPRSSRNKLVLSPDGSLKIWVTSSPTDGQANEAVCELVAKTLKIGNSRVTVLKGQTSRSKVLAIDGLTREECLNRIGKSSI